MIMVMTAIMMMLIMITTMIMIMVKIMMMIMRYSTYILEIIIYLAFYGSSTAIEINQHKNYCNI